MVKIGTTLIVIANDGSAFGAEVDLRDRNIGSVAAQHGRQARRGHHRRALRQPGAHRRRRAGNGKAKGVDDFLTETRLSQWNKCRILPSQHIEDSMGEVQDAAMIF
jgi:hypothetical protein